MTLTMPLTVRKTRGVARRTQYGRTVIVEDHRERAREVGPNVSDGLGEYLGVGLHEAEHPRREQETDNADGAARNQRGEDGGVHRFLDSIAIAGANVVRDRDARTQGEADEDAEYEVDERATRADGSQSDFSCGLGLAAPSTDDDGVGGVEQQLQGGGQDQGDREPNYVCQNGTARQIRRSFFE